MTFPVASALRAHKVNIAYALLKTVKENPDIAGGSVSIPAMDWLKEMSRMALQTHLPEHSINKLYALQGGYSLNRQEERNIPNPHFQMKN